MDGGGGGEAKRQIQKNMTQTKARMYIENIIEPDGPRGYLERFFQITIP